MWVDKIKTGVAQIKTGAGDFLSGGAVAGFFNFFQGRATWFALMFLLIIVVLVATGIWGFVHGKDLSSLAAFTAAVGGSFTAIQVCVFAHSCKEDWNVFKHRQLDLQQKSGSDGAAQ